MNNKHRIRNILGAGAVALTLAWTPAIAQDDDWGGFYAGVEAGGTIDTVHADATILVTQVSNLFVNGRGLVVVPGTSFPYAASHDTTNFDTGVHAGYLWQTGHFVFGGEGDFDPLHRNASVAQSHTLPATALTPGTTIADRRDVRFGNQWSARVRLGYAFGKTLVYATGGYAGSQARVTSIDSFTNPGGPAGTCAPAPCQANLGPEGPVVTTASASRSIGGWTAGAGIEERFGRHIGIALEYRHTDFGGRTFTPSGQTIVNTGPTTVGDNGQAGLLGSASSASTHVRMASDSLGLRLSWRF